jgi:hypothetical protein
MVKIKWKLPYESNFPCSAYNGEFGRSIRQEDGKISDVRLAEYWTAEYCTEEFAI